MDVSLPALANGVAFKLMLTTAFTFGQGEMIPFAVRVKVTDPVAPDGGVNDAFKAFAFGVKLPPLLDDQTPPEAPPEIFPDNVIACPEQDTAAALAVTTAF